METPLSGTQNRRQFLGQCSRAGMVLPAGILCISCGRNKSASTAEQNDTEFAMTAYCALQCDECDAYLATQADDAALKAEVAERWGMEPEAMDCDGCKSENALFNCPAKQCAIEKGVITCAHCSELPDCDNEQWTKYPSLKEQALSLRAKLEADKKL